MSNILNIKNLDGDWDSIVAIRGKQGEPGADGTKFEVNARFVPGNNVVPIADFITDKGTPKEVTHTIYAPKGEGGGTTVVYTDLHTFTDTMTVGEISVDGEQSEVVIPANVSEFANDAGYVTRNTNVSTFNNDAGYVTEEAIPTVPTKVSELENDAGYVGNDSLEGILDNVADISNVGKFSSTLLYNLGDFCAGICEDSNGSKYVAFCCAIRSMLAGGPGPAGEDFNSYIDSTETLLGNFPGGHTVNPLEMPAHSVATIYKHDYFDVETFSDDVLKYEDRNAVTLVNYKNTSVVVSVIVSNYVGDSTTAEIRHYQNVSYWMPVPYCIAKPKEEGGGSTEKYMPGDTLSVRLVSGYTADKSSVFYLVLPKPIDESVQSVSATASYFIALGSRTSNPSLSVTIDDSRMGIEINSSITATKYNTAALNNVEITFA